MRLGKHHETAAKRRCGKVTKSFTESNRQFSSGQFEFGVSLIAGAIPKAGAFELPQGSPSR
jgi:hypothetical protein